MEQEFALKLCKVIRLQRRLERVRQVHERIALIKAVKEAKPTVNNLLNTNHYAKATKLIVTTQQTLSNKLQGVKAVENLQAELEETKKLVEKLIDSELNQFMSEAVVAGVFSKGERLVTLLTNNTKDVQGIFPSSFDKVRAEDLIANKLNTGTLVESLAALQSALAQAIQQNFKKLVASLRVIKTDEQSKWRIISHSHLVIVIQAFKAICLAVFRSLKPFGLTVLEKVAGQPLVSHEYWQAKAVAKEVPTAEPLINQLTSFELCIFSLFTGKVTKVLQTRRSLLPSLKVAEVSEIFKECKELTDFYETYFHLEQEDCLLTHLLDVEREFLTTFHDKKTKEMNAILEGENWTKVHKKEERKAKVAVDVPAQPAKFVKITQTGQHRLFWSIHDLQLLGASDSPASEEIAEVEELPPPKNLNPAEKQTTPPAPISASSFRAATTPSAGIAR